MSDVLRRIPKRCLYCGGRIVRGYTCAAHRSVYESDPLGRSARLPLVCEAVSPPGRAEASVV